MASSNNDRFVIVIGETGSGKSTFINYVANAIYKNPSLDALQVIIPNEHYPKPSSSKWKHNERALDDPTLSKTVECQQYTFRSLTGKGFLIFIDTPGLGDTSGHLKDNENVDMIFKTIKSLEYISAIILIINGTVPRMTSNVSNVLTRFRQFFPDSIYTNMIVVFTSCQQYNFSFDKTSLNLPSTCRFFYMQNSAYCKPPDQIKLYRTVVEQEFKESIKTTREIMNHAQNLPPQSTRAFADLNDERYRLQAFLHEAYLMILQMEQVENELESLKKAENIGNANMENLIQRSKIFVLTTVPKDYYNIICGRCNIVCHQNCKLDEVPSEDSNPISRCIKMRNDLCNQCACSIELHYYGPKDLEQVDRPILDLIRRDRQRLRCEQEDHALTVGRSNSIEAIKIEVQKLLDHQCDRIRQACSDLRQSCQNINIAQELINFVQTLNQARRQLRSTSVKNRLDHLIDELESIASDCQQTGIKNSDNNLHCDMQGLGSAEATPPVPVRQTNKQQTPVRTPSYYRPDLKSQLTSSSKSIQKLPIQSQRYSAYSLERLIGIHEGLMRTKSEDAQQTLYELQERAKGNSVGLLNLCELAKFANHYADLRNHDKSKLQEKYDILAGKINKDIHRDASNLEHVEPDDLLKIAALSLLINPVTRM